MTPDREATSRPGLRPSVRLEPVVSLSSLREGDIVRGRASGDAYIVVSNNGDSVHAVRSVTITQPDEWRKVVHL